MNSFNTRQTQETRRLAVLALVLCTLPIVAINSAYLVAAFLNTVPHCNPYLDGCTSISSTGRNPPSAWIFKLSMLVNALLMLRFWGGSARVTRGDAHSPKDALTVLGTIGAAALILYLIFLGSEGPTYRLLRRYGVTVYFGCTYLAQLLLARRFLDMHGALTPALARWMLGVCLVLLTLGIISIPVSHFVADKDRLENIIEWNFALLMQLNFLFAWRAFRVLGQASDERIKPADER